jgi:hypothetical protein
VDDHARCLVEDGEVFVFEEDFEGEVLRGRLRGAVGRDPVMMSPGFRARLGLAVLPPARIAPSRRSD